MEMRTYRALKKISRGKIFPPGRTPPGARGANVVSTTICTQLDIEHGRRELVHYRERW